MSFLLDALGKAESDRDHGQVRELRTPVHKKQSPLKRLLALVLLLCLLLLSFAAGYFARPYLEAKLEAGQSVNTETPLANTALPAKPVSEAKASSNIIELSAISYSEKSEIRFVMLNNSVMYEGDKLPGGERILRIERHGVVLEKDGQQKRLGLNRSP